MDLENGRGSIERVAGGRALAALAGLALLGLLVPRGASVAAEETKRPPLAVSGERLYVRHCAVCHGRSATGDGPFAGILTVAPSDLTGIVARRGTFPELEIAAFVDGRFVPKAHGTREMPIWGRWLGQPMAPGIEPDEVTRGEVLAILTYLKTLQRPAPAAP
jgi:mono/diheme cytochrome c family protein